ncbi:helix-turn-helix domain-containing protein [Paracoccus sp. (in: a-proteobacteria)]|uniref:helix-turn-helix domain-containing protein n=1 Tax=Paracoccus sp. TaxID=267 RepID=UPI003A8A4130
MQYQDVKSFPPGHAVGMLYAADQDMPIESFNQRVQKVCGMFRADPADRRSILRGSVQHRRIARFDAAAIAVDADRVLRDKTMIRRDPGEHLFMLVQTEGNCEVTQRQTRARLARGDIFIVDSTLPSEFTYRGKLSRQLSLHLPRDEAQRRLGTGCLGGVALRRNDPLFPAVQNVVMNMARPDSGGHLALSEALLNILSAYFHARAERGGPNGRKDDLVYQGALCHIAKMALDADFSIDRLASEVGVSRRSLQRIFERNGDTVTGRVLAARLDTAWARLSMPGSEGVSVASVAFDCGFNDLSHFYRVFRARFGQPPGALRKPE